MKSEGYGGRAGGGSPPKGGHRDYSKPVQTECWLHGKVDCDDCTDEDNTRCRKHGLYSCGDCANGRGEHVSAEHWRWQDDHLVTAYTMADIENDEALLDEVATDVDAVERGVLSEVDFRETWGDEIADEFLPGFADREPVRDYSSARHATPSSTTVTSGAPPKSWSDWRPGMPYPVIGYAGTQWTSGGKNSKKYKPFWTSLLSRQYARSASAKTRGIGRRRDRQQGYRSCPAGRHWGPVGAAGILPYAVKDDGRIYVAMGKRSKAVQDGGTWAQFGGAIDRKDAGDFAAAERELHEEVTGLKGLFDDTDIIAEFRWDCPAECGWHYTMFVVRVHLPKGKLPKLSIYGGGSSWETDLLAWVPIDVVEKLELHWGFKRGWARARAAIENTEEWLAALEPAEQEVQSNAQ
jgi:8-oxo-dGTP pyrophosphatase MutT (NUDIX family)